MADTLSEGISLLSISKDTKKPSDKATKASQPKVTTIQPPHIADKPKSNEKSTAEDTTLQSPSSSQSSIPVPTPPAEATYFQRFPGFVPRLDATFQQQFNALAAHQKWTKAEKKRRRNEAISEEFNWLQGTDTSKLAKWQDLCCIVGIEVVPNSIKQCKKELSSRKVMINLTNLIDHMRLGTPLIKFKNFSAFRNYTLNHIYPKRLAKQDGFISALLRHSQESEDLFEGE